MRTTTCCVLLACLKHIPNCVLAGTFLHGVLQRVLPASGSGKWCTRGADSTTDLPLVSATCGRGDPPPDQVELFEATRKSFRHTCSGFTAHQDVEYFNAVGIDYNQTLTVTALRHPVDRVISEVRSIGMGPCIPLMV